MCLRRIKMSNLTPETFSAPGPLRCVLITQGISPVVKPLLKQTLARIVGIVESAPRGYDHKEDKRYDKLTYLHNRFRDTLDNLCRRHKVSYFLLHKRNFDELSLWLQRHEVD